MPANSKHRVLLASLLIDQADLPEGMPFVAEAILAPCEMAHIDYSLWFCNYIYTALLLLAAAAA